MNNHLIRCLFLALLGTCAMMATGQVQSEINPIYKGINSTYLSLLMRESPQKIKKVYGTADTAGMKGDTVMVAFETAPIYAKLIKKMNWPLVPREVEEDTNRYVKPQYDSTLRCEANTVGFNMVRVDVDTTAGKGFLIGQTEVTQELWVAVMYSNPSEWVEPNSGWPNYYHPVENVTWREVQVFLQKLNKMTGRKFRLPRAREWEFAARGGLKGQGRKYAGSDTLGVVAWYKPQLVIGEGTKDVATKAPNELGIYDMNGNVWEYTAERFKRRHAEWTIMMGGAVNESSKECRQGYKKLITTNNKSPYLGFRLAEDL